MIQDGFGFWNKEAELEINIQALYAGYNDIRHLCPASPGMWPIHTKVTHEKPPLVISRDCNELPCLMDKGQLVVVRLSES